MRFAASTSHHPVTAHATGHVLGHVLEQLGAHPDLVFISASAGHAGALDDVAAAVMDVLSPTVLAGAASGSTAPVLSLWAALTGPVAPLRLDGAEARWEAPFRPEGVVILAAPDFGIATWLEHMARSHSGLPVLGTVTTSAARPTLMLGHRVFHDGAVGALIGPGAACSGYMIPVGRPVGGPMIVTWAAGRMVHELDSVPALRRLERIARDEVPAADVHLIDKGLHLGGVDADNPFPLLAVVGADRRNGVMALESSGFDVGQNVRFYVADPSFGTDRLEAAVPEAEGALLFMDGQNAPLAGVDEGMWSGVAWTGWAGAGAIGPVGGRSDLHRLGVAMAAFGGMNNT